jgi:hypothetical protein
MKIRKVVMAVLLTVALGLGSGFLLSGCSGVNNSLEKEHIMNGGCFITCYNKTNDMAYKHTSAGKYADYTGNKPRGVKNATHFKKIDG